MASNKTKLQFEDNGMIDLDVLDDNSPIFNEAVVEWNHKIEDGKLSFG